MHSDLHLHRPRRVLPPLHCLFPPQQVSPPVFLPLPASLPPPALLPAARMRCYRMLPMTSSWSGKDQALLTFSSSFSYFFLLFFSLNIYFSRQQGRYPVICQNLNFIPDSQSGPPALPFLPDPDIWKRYVPGTGTTGAWPSPARTEPATTTRS